MCNRPFAGSVRRTRWFSAIRWQTASISDDWISFFAVAVVFRLLVGFAVMIMSV
jgi:hypothetical protein